MSDNITCDRIREILISFKDAIKENFAHWENSFVKIEELEQLTMSFIKRTEEIKDSKALILLFQEYLNHFSNGHTLCFDQTIEPIRFDIAAPLGFCIEFIENCWTVTVSFIPELIAGDRIEYINNEPVDVFVNKQTKCFCELRDPTKTMRLNLYLPYLIKGPEFSLAYRDKNCELKNILVNRNNLKIPHPEVSGKWLDDSETAYIHIPSFLKPEYENNALELLKTYTNSKSLIVDVRGNRGGNTPHMFISALMNKPWRWWREKGSRDLTYSNSYFIQPQPNAYDKNLVILTDRNTFSSAEDFVMPFKDNKRAVIIGEKTFGSTGQPYFTTIDSILLAVGSKRCQLPDGTEFEGIGIEPDIQIDKKIDNIYSGKILSNDILQCISKVFNL